MFSTKSGASRLSLIVIVGLVVGKVVVAVITGSLSITAQAIDSILDLLAVGITFFAISIATKPADEEHPFGHGKVENLAAISQAALIFTAGGLIIYAAARRIMVGATIELPEAGIGMMAASIVASIFLSRHLLKVSRATGSTALEANAHNIAADVYSAAGVLAGLIAVRFTGLHILDPIIALAVASFVLKVGYGVLRKSFGELLDEKLPEVEENIIKASIMEHSGEVVSFHNLRTRRAGSQRYVDLHLVMAKHISVEEAHAICDELERNIGSRLAHTSVTIHVEPCDGQCKQCSVSCDLRDRND